MILLWFILGIALIFSIARYNESNKLFWTLFVAYILGFTGTKMLVQTVGGNKQSNVNQAQVYSTQVQPTVKSVSTPFQIKVATAYKKVTGSKPVGQSLTPDLSENDITSSEVSERTRDQPQLTLTQPPELWLAKGILTLHESG